MISLRQARVARRGLPAEAADGDTGGSGTWRFFGAIQILPLTTTAFARRTADRHAPPATAARTDAAGGIDPGGDAQQLSGTVSARLRRSAEKLLDRCQAPGDAPGPTRYDVLVATGEILRFHQPPGTAGHTQVAADQRFRPRRPATQVLAALVRKKFWVSDRRQVF